MDHSNNLTRFRSGDIIAHDSSDDAVVVFSPILLVMIDLPFRFDGRADSSFLVFCKRKFVAAIAAAAARRPNSPVFANTAGLERSNS